MFGDQARGVGRGPCELCAPRGGAHGGGGAPRGGAHGSRALRSAAQGVQLLQHPHLASLDDPVCEATLLTIKTWQKPDKRHGLSFCTFVFFAV